YRDAEVAVAREVEFLRGLGASPAEAADAVGAAAEWEQFTAIALPDRLLEDEELADVPGWKLRALHTPGHTPGHLCFVDERAPRPVRGRPGAAGDPPEQLGPAGRPRQPAAVLPGLAGPDAGPGRGRGAARARVAVPRPGRPGRRHHRPSRAAARRAAGRGPPS